MKNRFLIYAIFFTSVALISFSGITSFKNSGQAPTRNTGASGETTCAGCHSGGSYSGSMTFGWNSSSDLSYEPGKNYTITFTGNYGAPRYGFSMTALNDANVAVGSFALKNANTTSLITANNRQYVGHKNADATNSWSFDWTAPENDAGNVTFYYVINAANNQNNTAGDFIETGSATISGPATFIANTQAIGVSVFPNPANDVIQLVSEQNLELLEVWNIKGQLIYSMNDAGTSHTINVTDWGKGLYVIRTKDLNGMRQQKIMIE